MGVKNDYRVSAIVVLCKDCNQDVGLYPARHRCDATAKRPILPTLYSSTSSSSPWIQSPSSPALKTEETESTYFDYQTPTTKGKKLWGKVKENDKWKELIQAEKKAQQQEKQSAKLWEKLINVTMSNNNSLLYDDCPESDDDDWEGETHVSRILREYYENNRQPLPSWLLDNENDDETHNNGISCKQSRRLWQQQDDNDRMNSRQKELLGLRQNNSFPSYDKKDNHNLLKNSSSSSALNTTILHQDNVLKNSQSMPNVNENSAHKKPSGFANVTLSMNNSIRQLYPKRANTTASKYQYVSSTTGTTKSYF